MEEKAPEQVEAERATHIIDHRLQGKNRPIVHVCHLSPYTTTSKKKNV